MYSVMNNKQQQLLEKRLYSALRGALREEIDKQSSTRRSRVMKWLDSAQELHSVLSYRLFGASTQSEKDSARSLFSKKYRGAMNDNGSQYGFSEEEVNTLYSMMNKYIDKLR